MLLYKTENPMLLYKIENPMSLCKIENIQVLHSIAHATKNIENITTKVHTKLHYNNEEHISQSSRYKCRAELNFLVLVLVNWFRSSSL